MRSVEPVGGLLDGGSSSRCSSSASSETSSWRRLETAALMPARGVRRSWPTAASSAERTPVGLGELAGLGGLLGQLLASQARAAAVGERCEQTAVLGEELGARRRPAAGHRAGVGAQRGRAAGGGAHERQVRRCRRDASAQARRCPSPKVPRTCSRTSVSEARRRSHRAELGHSRASIRRALGGLTRFGRPARR